MKTLITFLSAAMFAFSGCVSKTTVKSSDPEATVQIGALEGKGVLKYEDSTPVWNVAKVSVKKENCKTLEYEIARTDDVLPLAIYTAPITAGLTLLWIGKYRSNYELAFECLPAEVKK